MKTKHTESVVICYVKSNLTIHGISKRSRNLFSSFLISNNDCTTSHEEVEIIIVNLLDDMTHSDWLIHWRVTDDRLDRQHESVGQTLHIYTHFYPFLRIFNNASREFLQNVAGAAAHRRNSVNHDGKRIGQWAVANRNIGRSVYERRSDVSTPEKSRLDSGAVLRKQIESFVVKFVDLCGHF